MHQFELASEVEMAVAKKLWFIVDITIYIYIVFMGFIIQLITLDDLKWFRVITPNV